MKCVDTEHGCVMFYAVFGGGSDYVYTLQFDQESGKIKDMKKIWNDGYVAQHPI